MKKVLALCLVLITIVSLTACMKSEAAKAADEMILAIGTVTLESKAAIEAAEAAVDGLEPKEVEQLDNLAVLEAARATYDQLVREDKAATIAAQIDAIGTVTLDSGDAIAAARAAYDAEDADVQALVSNYDVLTAAEQSYAAAKAQVIIDQIDALGKITLESRKAIVDARNAYNALNENEKALVTNYNVLTTAVDTYNDARETAKDAAFKKLTTETDKVNGITWYYPKGYPNYINTRSYVLPYLGKNASSTWMRLVMNYTGDDWVFFESITLVVDGQRYYKVYNYFDVERDNGYGDVWEYVDISPSEADIEMLRAIANSKETIVRFQGDNYHYDLTIKASDKTAIKQILDAYELVTPL